LDWKYTYSYEYLVNVENVDASQKSDWSDSRDCFLLGCACQHCDLLRNKHKAAGGGKSD
jgi:hypothetical protein